MNAKRELALEALRWWVAAVEQSGTMSPDASEAKLDAFAAATEMVEEEKSSRRGKGQVSR